MLNTTERKMSNNTTVESLQKIILENKQQIKQLEAEVKLLEDAVAQEVKEKYDLYKRIAR
mgnify:CR=1 FL=1|jgi:hypothetical protein